jgi:predicted permease
MSMLEGWRARVRRARGRSGGLEPTEGRSRDERRALGPEDVIRDLAFGARSLRRSPAFTFTAVVTLALGIGAVAAAFSLLDGVLLAPLPYGEPERIVEVRELGEGRRFFPSFPNFVDWRERSRSFSSMTAVQPMGAQPVLDAGEPVRVPVVMVGRDFLETLGVPPFLGRDMTAAENAPDGPPVALVSHAFWVARLGAERDLERLSLTAFGSPYRVVGVLAPGFRILYDADLFIAAERWPGTVRNAHAYRVVGRLADGVPLDAADGEMDALTARMKEAYGGDTNAESAELRRLDEVLLGGQRRPLAVLLAAAALVLLVACANVAGTLLARGSVRGRELAVRTSLGATRARLVRQLLTESVLLTAVAGAAGAALAWVAVAGAVRLGSGSLPRLETVALDARALLLCAAVALGTAFLFGLYPALRLTRGGVSAALRSAGRGGAGRRGRVWDALVGAEVALAVVLLVGAGLLLRSLASIVTLDAGWRAEGVLQMSLTPPNGVFDSEDEAVAYLMRVREDIAGMPGVRDVGVGTFGPLDAGTYTAPARDPVREVAIDGYAGWRLVDAGYFRALSVPLLKGRLFEPGDRDVAIVNEALARGLWGDEDPIGQHVASNFDAAGTALRVVGVVGVARDWRMDQADQMEMFEPWWSQLGQVTTMRYLIRTDGRASALIAPVRERVRALNQRVPVEFATLEGELAASTADRRFVASVLAAFALVGLVLALVGIAGVVAYTVAQRRREIAIRMALGAAASRVRREVRAEVLRPTLVGLVVGLAAASALSRFVRSVLYEGVGPHDPATLAGVAALFLVAALATSDIPARRTAAVEPAGVLRED